MFGLHWGYIVLILLVVLIIFGPGRLPELGGAVGKGLREFRKASSELTNEIQQAAQTKSEPAGTSSAASSTTDTTKSSTPETKP